MRHKSTDTKTRQLNRKRRGSESVKLLVTDAGLKKNPTDLCVKALYIDFLDAGLRLGVLLPVEACESELH